MASFRLAPPFLNRMPAAPSRRALAIVWVLHCSGGSLRAAGTLLPPGTAHRLEQIGLFGLLTFVTGLLVLWAHPVVMAHVKRSAEMGPGRLRPWLTFWGGFTLAATTAAALRGLVGAAAVPALLGAAAAPSLAVTMAASWLSYLFVAELVCAAHIRLRESQEAQRELSATIAQSWVSLVGADDAFRREVAELLHGRLQSYLVVALYRLDQAERTGQDPAARQGHLQAARDALAMVSDEAETKLSPGVHPGPCDLRLVIGELVERFRQVRPITWQPGPEALEVSADHASTTALMVLEALLNAFRHAGPCRIVVSATRDDGRRAVVRVQDDGCGFDSQAAGKGLGLRGLGQALTRSDAAWQVESAPGRGTVVTLALPTLVARTAP